MRILPHLPTSGPLTVPFPTTGAGSHREGLVVEFTPSGRESWTGNFQRGLTDFDAVFPELGEATRIVVAGGDGYVIDEVQKKEQAGFGGALTSGHYISDRGLYVFSSPSR